jgi:hypothetical protein
MFQLLYNFLKALPSGTFVARRTARLAAFLAPLSLDIFTKGFLRERLTLFL